MSTKSEKLIASLNEMGTLVLEMARASTIELLETRMAGLDAAKADRSLSPEMDAEHAKLMGQLRNAIQAMKS